MLGHQSLVCQGSFVSVLGGHLRRKQSASALFTRTDAGLRQSGASLMCHRIASVLLARVGRRPTQASRPDREYLMAVCPEPLLRRGKLRPRCHRPCWSRSHGYARALQGRALPSYARSLASGQQLALARCAGGRCRHGPIASDNLRAWRSAQPRATIRSYSLDGPGGRRRTSLARHTRRQAGLMSSAAKGARK